MDDSIQIRVQAPVYDSFRVQQISSIFDVTIEEKVQEEFKLTPPPGLEEDWKIGLIVGPSGSGKSTVARHLYKDFIYEPHHWSNEQAVIDGFGEYSIHDITKLLTTVGFSSPPNWIKPYSVLSNGERFRCDLARALSDQARSLVVFDEFTSVVDRTVARIGSAAVAKGIRSGRIDKRFVAVSCHYDIADWLEPDWVLDMATGKVARRRLRRPDIKINIVEGSRDAWPLFARHHYLNSNLSRVAKCYYAIFENEIVGFAGVIPQMGHPGQNRITRIVILPDYQGVGIGSALLDAVGSIYQEKGKRLNIVTSHPAALGHCKHSTNWRAVWRWKTGKAQHTPQGGHSLYSINRAMASFTYVGE